MSDLLNSASLVLIPSGYAEDKVYSAVPTDGSGDMSFTRASNGTRVNSAGLVEVTPWNLMTYSEEFNNTSGWTKDATNGSITITANDGTAPNGTTTADRIQITKGTNYSQLYQTSSVISGAVYTISVYLKSLSGTPTITTLYDGTEKGTQTLTTDWVRYTFSFTATSSTVFPMIALYTGNSTSIDILAWGYQLNIGSTAKPYFPTTDRLNVPRLTYQNGGGGCPSLLLEKQSTNLALQSQSFTSPWAFDSNLGTTPILTANYGISPDGTQNASRLQLARTNSNLSYSQLFQYPIATTIGQQYTYSVWLKSLSGTPTVSIVSEFGRPTATLTSEWVRYTGTGTAVGVLAQLEIGIFGSTYSVGNSLSADILIWGYQFEASSYPTSYIPTTSASATRVADACSKTGISSLIGQTSGSVFADFVYLGGVQAIPIELSNAASNNIINVYITSSATTQSYMFNGGSQVGFINSSHTFVRGSRYKMAIGYASNDLVLYINGAQIGSATPSSIPTLSEVYISRDKAASYLTETKYNEMVIFPTRLTNSELASLTTL